MKLNTSIAALLITCTSATAFGAGEDIKGIKLGASREEIAALFPEGTNKITIAEVTRIGSKVLPIEDYTADGKVKRVSFTFSSNLWHVMRDAVKQKYSKKFKCSESVVQNGFGAQFTQIECEAGDIQLTKYSGDLETSTISMFDYAAYKREEAAYKMTAKKDL